MMVDRATALGLPDDDDHLLILGLLPRINRDKEIEILVLRHQPMVLQRQMAKPVL
ncbi:hypothetical protein ACIBO5_59405 [Nonomuraea angiospora]|uniref:hypothetical protein n=1 Tax=Nonomuraea angiospora TaxID=46172 RepID=UPI0037ABC98A